MGDVDGGSTPDLVNAPPQTFVALLRGINVGGHRIKMTALIGAFEAAGALRVRTYIQSGNVVFDAQPSRATEIAAQACIAAGEAAGFTIPVIVRSAAALEALYAAHPLADRSADMSDPAVLKSLHLVLVSPPLSAAALAALDPNLGLPDRYEAHPGHIYVHYAGGSARSKLNDRWLRTLAEVVTARNWRTIGKILALV